jgi:hypothetical protein
MNATDPEEEVSGMYSELEEVVPGAVLMGSHAILKKWCVGE